jgi:superfamily II DNA/RNA helicase
MGKFSYGNKNSQVFRRRDFDSTSQSGTSSSSFSGGRSNSDTSNSKGFKSGFKDGVDGGFRNTRGGSFGNSFGGGSSRGGFGGGSRGGFGGSSRGGFGGGRGNGGGSRGRGRQSFAYTESMFIKKAQPTSQTVEFVPTFQFSDLKVNDTLKKNILNKKFINPTPIQDQSIPHIMDGKDLLGIANTGTGKTAAFLIPLVEKVLNDRSTQILIVTPTRELAEQINEELYLLTRDLRIFSVQCIGGANISNQIYNLKRGSNFVIGTPGRLKDLLDRRVLNLETFNTVVLDEVDRMLDMGFVDEIKQLISYLPADRQSLFFSATLDRKVEDIINMILKQDHVKVSVRTGETAENVTQDIVRIESHDSKIPKLEELLNSDGFDKVLIFVNTKREVDHLDQHLFDKGYEVDSIHGERKQNQRKRSIDNFKSGVVKILIATDVAARGLDINDVTHVINYDIPVTHDDYIHRIGRTGRANKTGTALTFVESRRRF